MAVYNCRGSAATSYLSSPRFPSTSATCPGFANYLVCSPHNPETQAEEGLFVAFLQRRKFKGTGLISCANVKSSGSDSLGYHSEKGSEAESRPSGNNCGDCLVISASLCCIYCLCTCPVPPSQDGSPDSGPFPYPTMLGVQGPHWGLGRNASPVWLCLRCQTSFQHPTPQLRGYDCPGASDLGAFAPCSGSGPSFTCLSEIILGPRTAGMRDTWPLSSLLGQHLPFLPPETTGA